MSSPLVEQPPPLPNNNNNEGEQTLAPPAGLNSECRGDGRRNRAPAAAATAAAAFGRGRERAAAGDTHWPAPGALGLTDSCIRLSQPPTLPCLSLLVPPPASFRFEGPVWGSGGSWRRDWGGGARLSDRRRRLWLAARPGLLQSQWAGGWLWLGQLAGEEALAGAGGGGVGRERRLLVGGWGEEASLGS